MSKGNFSGFFLSFFNFIFARNRLFSFFNYQAVKFSMFPIDLISLDIKLLESTFEETMQGEEGIIEILVGQLVNIESKFPKYMI